MAEQKYSTELFDKEKPHTALANDLELGAPGLADQQKQFPQSQIQPTASTEPKAEDIDSRYLVSPFSQVRTSHNLLRRYNGTVQAIPKTRATGLRLGNGR